MVGRIAISILQISVATFGAKAPSHPLEGIWKSQGYGYVFQIRGSHLKAFEVTSTTCVAGFTARLQKGIVSGLDGTFKSSDGDLLFFRTSASNAARRLHFEGSASDVQIDRQPTLPKVCDQPTPDTPAGNFEVFTRTFDENYIAFGIKHVDWAQIVAKYRPKIIAQTTPAELFDTFKAMIEPFGDAHTFISSPHLRREFEGFRPGEYQLGEGKSERQFRKTKMPVLFAVTERAYLNGPLKNFANGQLQYGHIGKNIGYLRILAEGGYTKHGGATANVAVLEAALDKIFSDPLLQALVLDLRINFGGSDQLGLAIASRLATREYLAFTKYARLDPVERDRWTPSEASLIRPSSRPSFHGPVVELTGPLMMSAGETFTQALMSRTPRILRIGENTQGLFSDVLARRLPNKWTFGLPNEVFRTADGTAFDAVGIPPDIPVPVYADSDVMSGKDPALSAALNAFAKP